MIIIFHITIITWTTELLSHISEQKVLNLVPEISQLQVVENWFPLLFDSHIGLNYF